MTPTYASNSYRPELNAATGAFVSQMCFGKPDRVERFCSMAVMDGGQIVAGTLFYDWDEESGVLQMSSASTTPRWLTRPVIKAMFAMAFDMIGAQLAVLRVAESNAGMVAIAQRFGFDGVLVPRLHGRTESEWIFTLTDDAWRSSRWC